MQACLQCGFRAKGHRTNGVREMRKESDWGYIKLRNSGVVAIFDYLWYDGIRIGLFEFRNEKRSRE